MKTILLALLLIVCPCVFAASFDCTKAGSATEKLICSDEKISALDEDLAKSYKRFLDASSDKDSAKKTQIEWLKQQRSCKDAECLTQAYQSRISDLNNNATQSSNSVQSSQSNNKFKILKGGEYEVCRVFNDYLNSPYHKEGDCFINNYPADKRLRSPEFTKRNMTSYEEQEINARLIGKSDEVKDRYIQGIKRMNRENVRTGWEALLDISNNGEKKDILFHIQHHSVEDASSVVCKSISGTMDLIVNGSISDSKWSKALPWAPIIFDNRTF